MALFERDKEVLAKGPDSWEYRVRKNITLTSPTGQEFNAKWKGDPREFKKKLGVFEYPRVRGGLVQDLDFETTKYTFNIFFDGRDHDKEANQFFNACKERGQWEIIHPVHGGMALQLSSVSEDVQPVSSGGVTRFTTKWIESLDAKFVAAPAETAAQLTNKTEELNISAAQQFANNVSQAAEAGTQAIAKTTEFIVEVSNKTTGPLFQSLDALNSIVTATQRGIQDTITQATIIVKSLSGQVQNLLQTPAYGIPRADEKVKSFAETVSALSSQLPQDSFPISVDPQNMKNKVATLELALVALVGSFAQTVRLSDLETREQAISLAEAIQDGYKDIVDNLDGSQEAFNNYPADVQYTSQLESFSDATSLVNLAVRHLISISPDLQIERRFVLESPRSPIQIVLDEYGTLGENDRLLDIFIDTNQLKGDDILMLDRGREVVVYG